MNTYNKYNYYTLANEKERKKEREFGKLMVFKLDWTHIEKKIIIIKFQMNFYF